MPGKVKVKIISGRNLPVMDRSSDTTDAYVEIKLGGTTYKTDVCRKSLHPQWNSEWYRFEVDDAELQDEPLQIRLMDHDTYSANDAIGKVYLDLNPLLLPSASPISRYGLSKDGIISHGSPSNTVLSGWIPVYDTMHGIRGEVNILVKVELFSDFNRFRQSSCGVQFFCSPSIPHGYYAPIVHGFVEELIVDDDPEYKWIDKIRTPRASNEARQILFFKLSRELQRKIGIKALDLGGNAVIGYKQCFDLEGESGIVARAIGTSVTLVKMMDNPHSVLAETSEECAQSYLKFLGSNARFSLANEHKDAVFSHYMRKYHIPRLSLSSYLSQPLLTKTISNNEPTTTTTTRGRNKSNKSLKLLLEQEEKRGTPGSGFSQKFKNFKYSSQNMLSKKMTALKAKLGDSGIEESLERPDNADSIRRKSPFVFKRTASESNVMAEVLARSVIHAHNSLSSILECQVSTPFDEGLEKAKKPEECESDSENGILKVDDAVSSDTSESLSDSSSSDDEDDDDEDEDDLACKGSDSDFDTVSNIVKNVERIERRRLTRQYSLPVYTMAEDSTSEEVSRGSDENKIAFLPFLDLGNSNIEIMTTPDCEEIQNDSTFSKPKLLEESPKLDKEKCFDLDSIVQDNDDIETEQNEYLKLSNEGLSSKQEGSCLELPIAKEHEKKTIIPPIMLGAEMPRKGLLKTAMQTMLLEKVNIIGTYTPPGSPISKSQEFPVHSSVGSSRSSLVSKSFVFHDPKLSHIMPRSHTTTSLHNIDYKRDTVLGMHFTSLSNIRRLCSHPCLSDVANNSRTSHRETVLGGDFHSIRLSQKAQTCFSDSELHKANTQQQFLNNEGSQVKIPCRIVGVNLHNKAACFSATELNKNNMPVDSMSISESEVNQKNKETFLHLLSKDAETSATISPDNVIVNKSLDSNLDSPEYKSETASSSFYRKLTMLKQKPHKFFHNLREAKSTSTSDLHRRKFSLFHRKSLDNISLKGAKEKSMSLLSGIFQKHGRHKDQSKLDKESFKKHGLVGTALGNVVMETVQDILATSHPDHKKNTEDSNEKTPSTLHDIRLTDIKEPSVPCNLFPISCLPSTSSPPQLTVTNTNSNVVCVTVDKAPVNMQIDEDANINNENNITHARLTPSARNNSSPLPEQQHQEPGHHRGESVGNKSFISPAKLNSIPCIHRRSSDSDLSITPKGNSLTGSDRSCGGTGLGPFVKNNVMLRNTVPQENFDMLEYPFLTMSKCPPGFIIQLGGAVFARSVKLLERISNLEEPESRDTWWSELRMEIRSHARALNCNAVLGYTETTSICDDVCVLSACGTAAVIGFHFRSEVADSLGGLPTIPKHHGSKDTMNASIEKSEPEKERLLKENKEPTITSKGIAESPEHELSQTSAFTSCMICHLPYGNSNAIPAKISKCAMCRSGKVPEVLLATVEMPDGILSIGRGCLLQSYACRPLKDAKAESNAKEISDGLPFLEYELHRVLVNKLKIKGMNAIFGLTVNISIGEKMMIGIATGTACYVAALPTPAVPKVVSDQKTDQQKLEELQKNLQDIVTRNREIYQLKDVEEIIPNNRVLSDNDDSEEEQSTLELSMGNKDCCVLQVDDPEDEEVLHLLMEGRPPDGFHVVNTECVPGLEDLEIVKNLQLFTQVYRAKLSPPYNLDAHVHRLLQTLYFKLRRMVPCALCDLRFRIELPEADEFQICVLGMALGLGDPQKSRVKKKNTVSKKNDEDLIFNLEEDSVIDTPSSYSQNLLPTLSVKQRPKSPLKTRNNPIRHLPYRERHGVDITPLSYVPGGKIERYLGNLNFFFIRETTSIREEGGLSGFIHSFATEVLAIVRAHVTALGGNAMVGYFLTECVINHSLHKNQVSTEGLETFYLRIRRSYCK